MTTDELRRELRNHWEACIPFQDAMAMVGAVKHPDAAKLEAEWHAWSDQHLKDFLKRAGGRIAAPADFHDRSGWPPQHPLQPDLAPSGVRPP
jgi:hypothetical protein